MKEELKHIIDKMFEIAGYDLGYNDMLGREDDWYSQYTMTQEQNDEWFRWCIDYLYNKRVVTSKRMAKREMSWINLSYGLRIDSNN
jgi:hypothetical protein